VKTPDASVDVVQKSPKWLLPRLLPLLLPALLAACGGGGGGPASGGGGTGQPTNHAPIANSGADQTVYAGANTASLDGSQSSDPDSDAITFKWSIIGGPAAGAALTNETTARPSLTASVPGVYTVRLIVGDGQLSSTPDDVTVVFTEGVLLQGDSAAKALDTLLDMPPVGVSADKVQDGIILTRLDVFLNPAATVGQLNAALKNVQGSIVTMFHKIPTVTIAIPPPASIDALTAVAATLNAMPGVALASLARVPGAKKLPPSPAGDQINLNQLGQLIPARFPAAWNASLLATNGFNDESACAGRRVSVLIADEFQEVMVGDDEIQLSTETNTLPLLGAPAPTNELHGYEVAAILAAHFDSANPTGANPFTACLDLAGVQLFDLSWFQRIVRITSNFPAGKFLLNFSQGYFDKLTCLNTSCTCPDPASPPTSCTDAIVKQEVDTALKRAYDTIDWKVLTSPRWDNFLVSVAAGNEKDKPGTLIYSGLGVSVADSFMSIATLSDPLLTEFLSDASLWDPQVQIPPGGFPTLRADVSELPVFTEYAEAIGADQIGPAGNVLMVGATTAGFESQDLDEALSSDSNPDVFAVGRGIIMPAETDPINGTSFSAPQVTGLASYLWLLSSGAKAHIPAFNDLNALPSSTTRQAILANTRPGPGVNLIDAYATILSMDAAQLPAPGTAPIRLAILDLNNDGKFDEGDVAGFLGIYLDSSGAAREPSARDYSRFDLNGDGFTGGSSTERFDLDRVGSTQYGPTSYDSVVTQQIEGSTMSFDETKLTDLNILCYYAYSPLYTGDTAARTSLLASSCSLIVQPISVTLLPGQQQQFKVIPAQEAVTWTSTCGSINTTGLYTAAGASGKCTVRATSVANPTVFAEATVTVAPSGFSITLVARFSSIFFGTQICSGSNVNPPQKQVNFSKFGQFTDDGAGGNTCTQELVNPAGTLTQVQSASTDQNTNVAQDASGIITVSGDGHAASSVVNTCAPPDRQCPSVGVAGLGAGSSISVDFDVVSPSVPFSLDGTRGGNVNVDGFSITDRVTNVKTILSAQQSGVLATGKYTFAAGAGANGPGGTSPDSLNSSYNFTFTVGK
jgi:hypothetical protein